MHEHEQTNTTIAPPPVAEPPADRFESWAEAEAIALSILCSATGYTPGQSAFLGELNRYVNSFCFFNDPVENGGEVFYADALHSFCVPYTAVGLFVTRRDAQRFAMQIALALPVRARGNLEQLRLSRTGIGALSAEDITLAGEPRSRTLWKMPLFFDLVVRVQ